MLPKLTAGFPAHVRLLHEPQPGKANALRTAFREAQGQFFCIVDDDNLLESDYLTNGVCFLDNHPDVAMIGGRTFPKFADGQRPPADFEERYAPLLACRDKGEHLSWNDSPPGAGQMGRTAVMQAVYDYIGTRLEDRVGDDVGCCEDLEKAIVCKRLGWRTAHVPALRLQHVMTDQRLTPQYIDRLACAAIMTIPWLQLLSGFDPRSLTWQAAHAGLDRLCVLKYHVLSLLPGNMHSKPKRAPFWRQFYRARAIGYLSLIRDRARINDMLRRIENAPAELRGPAQQAVCSGVSAHHLAESCQT